MKYWEGRAAGNNWVNSPLLNALGCVILDFRAWEDPKGTSTRRCGTFKDQPAFPRLRILMKYKPIITFRSGNIPTGTGKLDGTNGMRYFYDKMGCVISMIILR